METTASQDVRWGMVVDINRCVGCQTCTVACKHTNDTMPGVQWRSVIDVELGKFPDVDRLFMVVGCQHCAEPPCVPVCPTGATAQRADGLITQNYELCIGCASCAVACPYQARTIAHHQSWYFGRKTKQEVHDAHPERLGVMQKCTFCVEKVDEARETGRAPGVNLEVTPACAASCISQAMKFGDYNDPDSIVSQLTKDRDFYQMHADLGTDPQIRYLYRRPAVDSANGVENAQAIPSSALAGKRQKVWDIRAALNFIMGGMTSGTMIVAYLYYLLGGIDERTLVNLYLGAAVGMGLGLFSVFLKIGRKLRFMFAFLRPHSSWMTREMYVVVLLYPLLLAEVFFPGAGLHGLVAVLAATFLYCQAKILHMSKGIPTWRAPLIPTMIIATGLLEGTGLLVAAAGLVDGQLALGRPLLLTGLLLAGLNAVLWRRYCASARQVGIGPLSRADLAVLTPRLHMLGHGLPALVFAAALAFPGMPGWDVALGGIAAALGGAMWKHWVINRACHVQGYAPPPGD